MNILQIDTILLKIIYYLDIEDLSALLIVNKYLNYKIIKYYANKEFVLNNMPLFRLCNDISTYLQHYKSFIFGKDFPDEPLWLFDNETDCKFVEINNKYVKLENVRFVRPRFCNYVSNYEYLPFKGGLYYWSKLNKVQKYLIWCAITGYHPEILLKKMLTTNESFIDLLSELSWHYQKSFVRYYLEIYSTNIYDLSNTKKHARVEICGELQCYMGNYLLTDNKINYEDLFDPSKSKSENEFRLNWLNILNEKLKPNELPSFGNLNIGGKFNIERDRRIAYIII